MIPTLWTIAQAQGQQGWGSMLFPFVLVIVIWYFLVIRPQNKQQEEKQKMLAALKKGDKVVISSGIHGRVAEVQKDVFLIEIADKIRVKVNREAVQAAPESAAEGSASTPEST